MKRFVLVFLILQCFLLQRGLSQLREVIKYHYDACPHYVKNVPAPGGGTGYLTGSMSSAPAINRSGVDAVAIREHGVLLKIPAAQAPTLKLLTGLHLWTSPETRKINVADTYYVRVYRQTGASQFQLINEFPFTVDDLVPTSPYPGNLINFSTPIDVSAGGQYLFAVEVLNKNADDELSFFATRQNDETNRVTTCGPSEWYVKVSDASDIDRVLGWEHINAFVGPYEGINENFGNPMFFPVTQECNIIVSATANCIFPSDSPIQLSTRLNGDQNNPKFKWEPVGNGLSNSLIPNPTVSWKGSPGVIDYKITASDDLGCSVSRQVTINHLPQPTITGPAGDLPIGGSKVLYVTNQELIGASFSYQWYLDNVPIPGAVAYSYIATQAGDYKVVVSSAAKCSDESNVITVSAINSFTDIVICASRDNCITLPLPSDPNQIPATADSIRWSTNPGGGIQRPDTFSTVVVCPTRPGIFTYTVTYNDGGSLQTRTFTVENRTVGVPTVNVSGGSSTVVCRGESVPMEAQNIGAGCSVQWLRNSLVIPGATGSTYNATETGNYNVVVNCGNCSKVSQGAVSVRILDKPTVVVVQDKDTICPGELVRIQIFGGGPFTSYEWSPNDLSFSDPLNPVASPNVSTTYTLKVDEGSGCTFDTTIRVVVVQLPDVNISAINGITQICEGDNTDLMVTVTPPNTPGLKFQWRRNGIPIPGANGPILNVKEEGNYDVTVGIRNCTPKTASITVTVVSPRPTAVITTNDSRTGCNQANGVTFTLESNHLCCYQWYRDNNSNPVGNNTNTYTATTNGLYYAEVTVGQCKVVSNKEHVTITAGVPPTVSAIPQDSAVCVGGRLQISSIPNSPIPSPGFLYEWTPIGSVVNPAVQSTFTDFLTTNTTFCIRITDRRGCEAKDCLTIRVADIDAIEVKGQQTFCENEKACMESTFGRGLSYQWFKVEANGARTQIPGATWYQYCTDVPGDYELLIDGNNCTPRRTNVFTINSIPSPKIALNDSIFGICRLGNAFIEATITQNGTSCPACTILWGPPGTILPLDSPNPIAGPEVTTTYTVEVNAPNGCRASRSVLVKVAEIGKDTTKILSCTPCAGGKVVLSASTGLGYKYQWYYSNPNPTPLGEIDGATNYFYDATQTGYYSVKIEGNNAAANCPQNYIIDPAVLVPAIPGTNIGGHIIPDRDTLAVCTGATPQLSATGGTDYEWSVLSGDFSSLNPSLIHNSTLFVKPDVTTTYRVKITNTGRRECLADLPCVTYDTITVRVVKAFCAPENIAVTICEDQTLRLDACTGVGFDYLWFKGGNPISGESDYHLDIPNIGVLESGIYAAQVITEPFMNCPSSRIIGTFDVTVNPKPTIEVQPTHPAICPGGSVQLIPNGGIKFEWSPTTGLNFTMSPATPFKPLASPTQTTDYTLTVTGFNGCIDSTIVTVKVVQLDSVIVELTSDNACEGQTVEICASSGPGFAYQWRRNTTDIDGANEVCYAAGITGLYDLTISGLSPQQNCPVITTPSRLITIKPNPIAVAEQDTATCINNTTAPILLNGGNSVGTIIDYAWTPATYLLSPNTKNPSVVNPSSSIDYVLTVTAANGCIDTATIHVAVVDLDTVRVLPEGVVQICDNETVMLSATQRYLQYQWFLNGLPIAGANKYQLEVNTPGLYNVEVSAAGCVPALTSATRVIVNPSPTAAISAFGPTEFCEGGSVTLGDGTQTGANTLQWLRDGNIVAGETAPFVTANESGQWILEATNNFGCVTRSNAIPVIINENPDVEIIPGGAGPVICQNQNQELLSSITGGLYNYTWTHIVTPSPVVVGNSSSLTITEGGTYVLEVIDGNGCRGTDEITISTAINTMQWDKGVTFTRSPASCGESSGFISGGIELQFPGQTIEFFIARYGDTENGPYLTGFNFIEFHRDLNSDPAYAISPGFYYLKAVDAAGCYIDTVLSVSDQVDFNVVDMEVKEPTCANDDGEISICVEGAPTGEPYYYSKDNGRTYILGIPVIPGVSDCYTFTGLSSGTYPVLIKRGECIMALDDLIHLAHPDVVDFAITDITVKNVSCDNNDGSITVTADGQPTGKPFYFSLNGGTSWELGIPNTPGVSDSYTYNNLAPGTYTIIVKRNDVLCSGVSTIVTVLNECCPAPDVLLPTPGAITYTEATVSWNAVPSALGGYEIKYCDLATNECFTLPVQSSTFITLTNLKPSRDYEVCVRTLCDINGTKVSVYNCVRFSTQQCNPPEILEVQPFNVTFTTATITWTSVSEANAYELLYSVNGEDNWTGFITTAQEEFLFDLDPCTEYIVAVRSLCGVNNARSEPVYVVFNTPCCNTPLDVRAENVDRTSANILWEAVDEAAQGYILTYAIENFPPIVIDITDPAATSYLLTGLQTNMTYIVTLRAKCADGVLSDEINTSFTTLPIPDCDSPVNLTLTDITGLSAVVNWDPVPGAQTYEVSWILQPFGTLQGPVEATATSYLITNLDRNSTYLITVRSVCEDGFKSDAIETPVTTRGICESPAFVNLDEVLDQSISISWNAISEVTKYEVSYNVSGNLGTIQTMIIEDATTATLNNLLPATAYDIKVRSICYPGDTSGAFTTIGVTFPECESVSTPFSFENITSNKVTVKWTASANAIGYQISYRKEGDSDFGIPTDVFGTEMDIDNLEPGTTYEVQLCAICSGGFKSDCVIDIFTTPNACQSVTSVRVINVTATSADIEWDPIAGASRYRISVKVIGNNPFFINTETVPSNFKLTGLSPETDYEVRIITICVGNIESDPVWNSFSTNVDCGQPGNVEVKNPTSISLEVSWSSGNNALQYEISYRLANASWEPPITVPGTQQSLVLNALESDSDYEVRIRAICSGGVTSDYANGFGRTLPIPGDCQAPINTPIILNITSVEATVRWDLVPDVSAYRIYYRETNGGSWLQVTPDITSNVYTLDNLKTNTSYDVQVRSVCSGIASDPVYAAFSTSPASSCPVPQNVTVTDLTQTSGRVIWDIVPNATGYSLEYKADFENVFSSPVSLVSTSYEILGLNSATIYDVKVRAICPGDVFSDEVNADFTTLNDPACIATNFQSVSVTSTTALLTWDPVNSNQYEFRYRKIGESTWTVLNLVQAFVNLNNLDPASVYLFQIRGVCGPQSFAPAVSGSFTTDNISCTAPTNLEVLASATSAEVNWLLVGSATRYVIEWTTDLTGLSGWNSQSVDNPITTTIINGLSPNTQYLLRVRSLCNGNVSGFTQRIFNTSSARMSFSTETQHQVQVYPNPTTGTVYITIETPASTESQITILDLSGRVLATFNQVPTREGEQIVLPLPQNLVSGSYILSITNGVEISRTRLVLQR